MTAGENERSRPTGNAKAGQYVGLDQIRVGGGAGNTRREFRGSECLAQRGLRLQRGFVADQRILSQVLNAQRAIELGERMAERRGLVMSQGAGCLGVVLLALMSLVWLVGLR